MLSRWLRTHSHILRPFLLLLARSGITPNLLTLISLVSMVGSGFLLARGNWIPGGAVLLFGALLDGIDGELARVLNQETPLGGFIDSISDHCGDLAVSLGLVWAYLTENRHGEVILVFLALFGSMLGSQVRSRAGMVGIDTKAVGLLTRFERITILLLGILAGQITAALWVLAVLNNFSTLQRIIHIFHAPSHIRKYQGE